MAAGPRLQEAWKVSTGKCGLQTMGAGGEFTRHPQAYRLDANPFGWIRPARCSKDGLFQAICAGNVRHCLGLGCG
jgi:hypothetical protein